MAMTTDQIFKLLDAGYTKDEIAALEAQPAAQTEQAPKQETNPEPPANQDPTQGPKQETNPEPPAESEEVKKLKAQIAELQKEAAKNAKQTEPEKKLNSEGVIKSFFDRL